MRSLENTALLSSLAALLVTASSLTIAAAQDAAVTVEAAGPHYVTSDQSTEDEATTERVRRALVIVDDSIHRSADRSSEPSVLCVGAGGPRVVGGYPLDHTQTLVVVRCGQRGLELWLANHNGRMSFRAVRLKIPSQRAHVRLENRRWIMGFDFDTSTGTATHRATVNGATEVSTYQWMGTRQFVLDQHFAGPCEAGAECREGLGAVYTRAGHGR